MKSYLQINKTFPVFLLLIAAIIANEAKGQSQEPVLATSNTSFDSRVSFNKQASKRSRNIRIITTSIKEIGYGNRCVSEATHKLGFEYVPMPISEVEKKSALHYFVRNRIAGFRITLKNGLFWKHKLKKQIRQCRLTTGDFTG